MQKKYQKLFQVVLIGLQSSKVWGYLDWYTETGPVDLPDFSLEISSSISLKVVENIKKLGWIQLCK